MAECWSSFSDTLASSFSDYQPGQAYGQKEKETDALAKPVGNKMKTSMPLKTA